MLKNWKLRIASAALVAVSVTAGCFDFDEDLQKCQQSGTCKEVEGANPDDGGTDAGADAGTDAGCVVRDMAELPDDNEDFNCDGFDGVAATALFVDPANGGDSNTGSPDRPLQTLTEALARIQSDTASGKTAIYLARGTYKENGLNLKVPVSLHGGYGGLNDWFRKPEHTTTLNGGTVGLTVSNLRDAGIVLEWLTISSDNGVAPGAPSIALYMVDTDGVLLRQDILSAGLGATGATGAIGDTGIHGSHGLDGGTAIAAATRGEAGRAGLQACGSIDVSGGFGKKGAGAESPGDQGDNGKPQPPAGGGGLGGAAGVRNTPAPAQDGFQNCRGGDGSDGGTGAPGDPGIPGRSGGGMGELVDGMWVANQGGGLGGPGTPGAGGGGGGSGGSCAPVGTASSAAGGGSGGGGAGGCGGQGGKGGGGGGASIALLLVDSNVELSGVRLQTQGGGNGGIPGTGGQGGQGGQGGPGGAGGNHTDRHIDLSGSVSYNTEGGRGGPGGHGGNGGNGGPGGGGGGGPSVGVWCGPNSRFAPVEPLSDGELRPGGSGGASPGANPGNTGEKHLTHNCPDASTP